MTARAFLIRGLIAGLVAGIATFCVAYAVGEPPLEAAIGLEGTGAADHASSDAAHDHGTEASGGHSHTHSHSHGDDGDDTQVSRGAQRTWGLLTGSLAIGLALGGIVALVAAATTGRMGRLQPGESSALVTLLGFVAYALVPFLKYPANPPAVGSGDTIGDRTALYFGFVLVSVLTAVAATYLALRLRDSLGTHGAVVAGAAGYLAVMVVAGQLFATVNEVGDFPADTLWFFRRASLFTLATMWGVIGVVLSALVGRLHADQMAQDQRRAFAASL